MPSTILLGFCIGRKAGFVKQNNYLFFRILSPISIKNYEPLPLVAKLSGSGFLLWEQDSKN